MPVSWGQSEWDKITVQDSLRHHRITSKSHGNLLASNSPFRHDSKYPRCGSCLGLLVVRQRFTAFPRRMESRMLLLVYLAAHGMTMWGRKSHSNSAWDIILCDIVTGVLPTVWDGLRAKVIWRKTNQSRIRLTSGSPSTAQHDPNIRFLPSPPPSAALLLCKNLISRSNSSFLLLVLVIIPSKGTIHETCGWLIYRYCLTTVYRYHRKLQIDDTYHIYVHTYYNDIHMVALNPRVCVHMHIILGKYVHTGIHMFGSSFVSKCLLDESFYGFD